MNINRDWFLQRLAVGNKSVRGLARHLEVDASAVSRMLSGQRKMRMDEAEKIANFLSTSVTEVLNHAGVKISSDTPLGQITLRATVGDDGAVAALEEPTPLPSSVFDRAQKALRETGSGKIHAVQVRASSGLLSILDDAIVLFEPSSTVDPASIGALSLCRDREGNEMIARVIRARRTGEAVVLTVGGREIETILDAATPILAVIP